MSDDRDFLAEARQSSELAMAMAEISTLTASATASLSRLDQPSILESSSSLHKISEESPRYPLNSSPVGNDSEYEYPDMSKYYSGEDYASKLPTSSSSSSNYISSFNIFSNSSKKDEDDTSGDIDFSKLRRDPLSKQPIQNSGDVSQQQLLGMDSDLSLTSDKGISILGKKDRSNVTFHSHGVKLPKTSSSPKSKSDEPLQRVMIFGRHGASPAPDKLNSLIAPPQAPLGSNELVPQSGRGRDEFSSGDVFEYALEMDQIGGPMAMCSIGDFVIIAEWGMHRLKIIKIDSKTGTLVPLGFFGQFGYADEDGKFNHPKGVAVQVSTGYVVVTDENDHLQVLKFSETPSPRLSFMSSFGRPSKGKSKARSDVLGFFHRPSGVAIHDESGLVFVVDSKNFRLQTLRLTADGHLQPVSKFGSGGGFQFKKEPSAISLHPTHPLLMVAEEESQCLHEIMINPGGHLSLRRSHCGKICSSLVTGSGLRVSGSRAAGPTSVLLMGDLVFITVADQISLLRWTDWSM